MEYNIKQIHNEKLFDSDENDKGSGDYSKRQFSMYLNDTF